MSKAPGSAQFISRLAWGIFAAAALAVVALLYRFADPVLLVSRGKSSWMRPYRARLLEPKEGDCVAIFRKRFTVEGAPRGATISVQALSEAELWVDGRVRLRVEPAQRSWKNPVRLDLPPLAEGEHELSLIVHGRGGPALARIDGPDLERFAAGTTRATSHCSTAWLIFPHVNSLGGKTPATERCVGYIQLATRSYTPSTPGSILSGPPSIRPSGLTAI